MKKIFSLVAMSLIFNTNLYAQESGVINNKIVSNNLNQAENSSIINFEKLFQYFSNSKYAVINTEEDFIDINCSTNNICTAMIYYKEANMFRYYNFYGYTNNETNLSYITINLVNEKNEIIGTNIEEYKFSNRSKRGILDKKILEAAAASVSAGAGADWAINKYGNGVGGAISSYMDSVRNAQNIAAAAAIGTYYYYSNRDGRNMNSNSSGMHGRTVDRPSKSPGSAAERNSRTAR